MDAATLAAALAGRKVGAGWMARCPAHEDGTPSLSIGSGRDGKLLVRCHAGCDQRRVIEGLRERGLWGRDPRNDHCPVPQQGAPDCHTVERRPAEHDGRRTTKALAIWQSARRTAGTLITVYLAARGLVLSPPPALRFHPGLKHPSGGVWPTMAALVTRGTDGLPLAIHRTFLARDGRGKAPVDRPKMMLGPCRGGAVRLAEPSAMLMVGEGIETCLAAMQATGRPAWAALSTSGLRSLDLPSAVREVIVLADGDDPGEAAAQDCARRWARGGRRVRIARPPRGLDFNDMLAADRSRIVDSAP